ncbi:catalase/peroxidase HPI [Hellea sp.]|nr:catalase/peroxidase HPI [Hellea sp.]MDA8889100.1 catalase/peroxidase HPI [Hellea sp.]MDB4845303.1 catalase/peroxidase HPI [Hellea sp.]MDC0651151.1 catalase/peroxidase HPI [Hellea sp.]MDC1062778.1 catalase/peroxidase HPI [Hellea sp.]MDC1089030.1 catalase/peroxidase HPI [Hellea sp.]
MSDTAGNSKGKCPVMHGANKVTATGAIANHHWWPEQLNLKVLNQNSSNVNPMDPNFSYAEAFQSLDLDELKKDLTELMTNSQDWWPADYGTYAGFFVRMTWHSAGTYRTYDGRGGANSGSQRFAPLNSWPDNGNLDKARRLLWPIKSKYGNKLSWADLFILAGNVAMESCGFKTFGFGGGREDVYEPEEDIYWGPETEWLDDKRYSGDRDLSTPLAAVQMGLIYVNPEGPNGNPDPLKSAYDIRDTFARMAMDDYETVALVAGGHTFGKGHGAGPEDKVGVEPEGAKIEAQGFGWHNTHGEGKGNDTTTAGFEGSWTPTPNEWNMEYFEVLLGNDWEQTTSNSGHVQWTPTEESNAPMAPTAHDSTKQQPLMMTTADMALKLDPAYAKISKNFLNNPEEFADAYARAWFKLTHRDMGPISCYLGKEVPNEELIWQDPVPKHTGPLPTEKELSSLKDKVLSSSLTTAQLVTTAWASAATFRGSDKRGGANGARIRLAPQKDWEVNKGTDVVISALEKIKSESNTNISLADLIVLGGCAAIERASGKSVPFRAGRTDATDAQTDTESFDLLEPKFDGFRNYKKTDDPRSTETLLVDRAQLLGLTAPEMTVLIGGLRSLGANAHGVKHGLFTKSTETLTNEFFINLLDMSTKWEAEDSSEEVFNGYNRKSGDLTYTGTRVDLVFGSNSILRGLAEVYAESGAEDKFTRDFIAAWNKVMMADRFDIK